MTCWLPASLLVLARAWENAFAVALPAAPLPLKRTLTKAEANAVDEALPDELAEEAACATAVDAACTLGEGPVKLAVTQAAASASADPDCSKERAGRASLCCKLATASTRQMKTHRPRFMGSAGVEAKRLVLVSSKRAGDRATARKNRRRAQGEEKKLQSTAVPQRCVNAVLALQEPCDTANSPGSRYIDG